MQRLTITIEKEMLEEIDRLVTQQGYASRSEAIRDSLRSALFQSKADHAADSNAYGVFSYVYQHDLRELSKRLTGHQHDHHDISVSTLHVHINHTDCLEVAVLRGESDHLSEYANSVSTQRGVRFAKSGSLCNQASPARH